MSARASSRVSRQADCTSGATMWCCSSQSRGSWAKLARSSAGRTTKGCLRPTLWMRARKRPIHSSTSIWSSSGRRPPRRGLTAKAKPLKWCSVWPFEPQGGHGRNLGRRQGLGKAVLFGDLGIAPAFRAVKLGHHLGVAFVGGLQVNLVDPVLETVERRHAAVAPQAHAGQCVLHHVGGECGVGMHVREAGWVHVLHCRRPPMPESNHGQAHAINDTTSCEGGCCIRWACAS